MLLPSSCLYGFQVALLTDFETSLLKAVSDIEDRFRFHQYSDLFNFVSQLSVGDRVVVQVCVFSC